MNTRVTLPTVFLVVSLAALSNIPSAAAQGEDLSVLSRWVEWSDAANMLQHRLNAVAFQLLENRKGVIRQLGSADDWRSRQTGVRDTLNRIVGPFPEKTPLNAKTVGMVKKDGYVIEKVVFESVPGFYVTGCLFIPTQRSGKAPAILNVIGHTDIAFRGSTYQQLLLNLVRKGFIVFAMDPVGQGERLQYYDPTQKRSLVGGPTTEHTYVGRQCFLAGVSVARYFVWDGIRAIDYLVSRPEVDPARIGVTGLSGGGTQTSYIAALDDRVIAAAPACYITTLQRLFESIGPQDAEQNFNLGVSSGIDLPDLVEVRAPKATLIVATTRDFFSIQGAREAFIEAQGAFRAQGAQDNLGIAEDDFVHGYTQKTREAVYGFFQKHLNNPGNPADEEVQMLHPSELTVTSTGQVSDSLGGETVFSLNRSGATRLIERLDKARLELPAHLERVKDAARRVSAYPSPEYMPEAIFRGRYQRSGYGLEMYVIPAGKGCIIPLLLMVPEGGGRRLALVYLHPQGKAAGASTGGEMERLVKQGFIVLAPDLSGTGELGRVSDAVAFLGVQAGRSVVGMRAADIARCVHFLQRRSDVNGEDIGAVARGEMGVPLLHAAALNESIKKVALLEPLVSFQSVVMNRYYSLDPGTLVANILTAYDLPDLAASLAPRELMLVNVLDHVQKQMSAEMVDRSYEVARRSYSQRGAAANLTIKTGVPSRPIDEILAAWLK